MEDYLRRPGSVTESRASGGSARFAETQARQADDAATGGAQVSQELVSEAAVADTGAPGSAAERRPVGASGGASGRVTTGPATKRNRSQEGSKIVPLDPAQEKERAAKPGEGKPGEGTIHHNGTPPVTGAEGVPMGEKHSTAMATGISTILKTPHLNVSATAVPLPEGPINTPQEEDTSGGSGGKSTGGIRSEGQPPHKKVCANKTPPGQLLTDKT